MPIKYERVFGDQSLFDNAPEDAEFACAQGQWYKTFLGKLYRLTPIQWKEVCMFQHTPNAMRRVIKTPTWTLADQEAGVLPPVGVKARNPNNFYLEGRIAAVNRCECCFVYDDGSMELLKIDDISPIETPEEKSARLKDEWCETVYALYEHGSIVGKIYETLLSGELKAPTND